MKLPKISGVKQFFRRVILSAHLMTKTEHILLYILIGLISFEVTFKGYGIYLDNTTLVPAQGGVYKEIMIGEVKYVNPIFTKTDAERSISRLVYSGLVKLDEKDNIVPDLAERWEQTPDGLTYRFYLKQGIYFHNGELLEVKDVVNTLNAIKNPDTKSPYQEIWSEVQIDSPEVNVIVIKIPRQNGSFIFNCLQGIVASNNLTGSLAETVNGTGPYRLKVIKDMKNGQKYFELEKYNFYYNTPALIPMIQITTYENAIPKEVENSIGDFTAIAGAENNNDKFLSENFQVGRTLLLIPNLKNPSLADNATRAKVMKFEKFDTPMSLKLISLDAPKQKAKVDEIKNNFKDKNVNLDVQFLSSVDFYKKVFARDFDLVIYGADFGYDRDPYAFWHSSQISFNNLASYSNKAMDIKLEDARMINDIADRNNKYDEIYVQLQSENLIIIYPNVKYDFRVKENLRGLSQVIGSRPEDRFNTISNWYLEQERVRKKN
jgi:MarR-like DNA-binding transcriptional regulator SgrR of sgrS sRNA